jgi:hypothetical protein
MGNDESRRHVNQTDGHTGLGRLNARRGELSACKPASQLTLLAGTSRQTVVLNASLTVALTGSNLAAAA